MVDTYKALKSNEKINLFRGMLQELGSAKFRDLSWRNFFTYALTQRKVSRNFMCSSFTK